MYNVWTLCTICVANVIISGILYRLSIILHLGIAYSGNDNGGGGRRAE